MNRIESLYRQYEFRVRMEAHLKLIAHGYEGINPTPDAPDTLDKLVAEYAKREKLFPVFDGGTEHTIFQDPESNLLFRAWHDLIHIETQAPFNLEGEQEVAREQIRQASFHGCMADILWADVVGQTEYFNRHGEFPVDQKAFVTQFLMAA